MRLGRVLTLALALTGGTLPALAQDAEQEKPVQAAPIVPGSNQAAPARPVETQVVDPSRFGGTSVPALKSLEQLRQTPNLRTPQQPEKAVAGTAPRIEPKSIDPDRFGGKRLDEAYGAFQRGLYKTAYDLALKRAEAGDAAAQTLVGQILGLGLGVKQNQAESAKWYALAAEQGVPEAQFQHALDLIDGRFVKRDRNAAFALMQAAAEAGNRYAQFNLGQMIMEREPGDKGFVDAAVYFDRAAQTGLPDALYAMSQFYANGIGGKKQDDVEARKLMVMAARQGHDTAQYDLSIWMAEGRGGDRDYKSAFGWMKLAADQGNVAARAGLAKFYLGGIGVDPDSIMAAAYYMAARRAGLVETEMEDHLEGLTDEELKQAAGKAAQIR